MNRLRILLFILVAELHCMAILFVTLNAGQASREAEAKARVMKLVDITEYIPPPPDSPPPPPPPPQEAPPPDNAVETIAEEMFETGEAPENQTVVEAGSIVMPQSPAVFEEEYLPAHKISVNPEFPNAAILRALRYPPIARRSNIEGRVILDLFVDRTGVVRRIEILLEDPLDRGFGEAAVSAIWEALRNPENRCRPAQANGAPVSARVRYPVTFRLR
jgi:protein TonB